VTVTDKYRVSPRRYILLLQDVLRSVASAIQEMRETKIADNYDDRQPAL
jgi:hypothetical protein